MIDVRTTLDVAQWAPAPTASPSATVISGTPTDAELEAIERRRRRPFGFARALLGPRDQGTPGNVTPDGPLYHGGVRRLDRRGVVLPPSRTGMRCASDYGAGAVHRRDRVYVTTDLDGARLFALMAPGGPGDIYLVQPLGELEIDPDDAHRESWQAPMARIVRVVERNVTRWQGLTLEEALNVVTPDGDRYLAAERVLDLRRGVKAP